MDIPISDVEYKLVIVGGEGVGKSALTIQLIQGKFVTEYDPTIEDSYRKQFTVDDDQLILEVLDTAGQEEYAAMRDCYIRTGHGFVVTYSITNRDSFVAAENFRQRILLVKDDDDIPMILAGNKCDLEHERQVPAEEGSTLAKKWGKLFYETSAMKKINVQETFFTVVREIRKTRKEENVPSDPQKKRS